jgi:hypothetical protein
VALGAAPLAIDLSSVSAGCPRKIDGLLGADFFRSRVVIVDFAASKIRLPGAAEIPPGSEVLSISSRNGAMCVKVCVGNCQPGWMRLDTGCNSAVQFAPAGGGSSMLPGASVGLTTAGVRYVQADVRLGDERLAQVKVGVHSEPIFSGESGLLGTGLLSRFKSVTFDAPSNRVIFAKR